jgi:hypothetical protein
MADNKKSLPINASDHARLSHIEGARIGKIAGADTDGRILVDFLGNSMGPISARLTSSTKEMLQQAPLKDREVLLVFENNDPTRPVIIDTLYSLLDEITDCSEDALEAQKPEEVTVDRKQVIIDADEEIVLRCGEASITLTRAGKVIIRGNYLLSNSSGANRIKGGSVQIN